MNGYSFIPVKFIGYQSKGFFFEKFELFKPSCEAPNILLIDERI
jgi:hypothetical protein